ncbi:MAG: hypothetical protein JWP76_1382 [Dactylosporangium sp.]|nr:hypothetical protein [Dactylosporangium sp.]
MSWLAPTDFDAVLEAATPAPSILDSQPWRFRLGPTEIDLLVDADRRLPAAGASGRASPDWASSDWASSDWASSRWASSGWASRLACGAALFNLRVALAVRDRAVMVRLQPDRTRPELLARLTPDAPRPPTPTEVRLYRAIPRQHSDRTSFLDRPVPVEVRAELLAAARAEHAWLDLLIGPAAVQATAGLVQTAGEILDRDAGYRAGMLERRRAEPAAAQMKPVDGVPASAGGPAPRSYEMPPGRDFGSEEFSAGFLGGFLDELPAGIPGELPSVLPSGLPSRREVEREPLIAVLGGSGDWPADQVQAGQALQRVLLTATDLGLAASMFSQPIEVASVREQLRLALGRHAAPQMLIRFGYATPTPPGPRSPVVDRVVG